MAFQHAAGIGVHDEYRVIAGVKQDGVSGFRANTVEGEKFIPEFFCGLGEHAAERAGVMLIKKADKGFEISGLLAEIAGWSDQNFQFRQRHFTQGGQTEQTCMAQIGQGFFNIAPIGVLREVGTHNHFKA